MEAKLYGCVWIEWRPGSVNFDGDELIACPSCYRVFVDGYGCRINGDYLCDRCYNAHPVIAEARAWQARADERRDGMPF